MPPGPTKPVPQLEQIVSSLPAPHSRGLLGQQPLWGDLAEPCCSLPQNAEIFTLTYGSMVRQLIADFEDLDEVNKQLEKM